MTDKCTACAESQEKINDLKKIVDKYKDTEGSLIQVLHEAQELYGYLPIEVMKMIAEGLGVPLEEVYGVATFYAQFTLNPKGSYQIAVCLGTACYVKGSGDIVERISRKLGVEAGSITPDGKFSLEACRCVGACGLAPVMMINDDVHGRLTPGNVEEILAKYE